MEYRTIGRTGVRTSQLCFGTMSFGGDADEVTAREMFAKCRDVGINFFDTADVYNGGRSEEILGRCIEGIRNEVIISTKVFFQTGEDINARGLSRRHIMQAAEQSLQRLNTDRIDFYFVHAFDDDTSIEETLRAMEDLKKQGKILYPAASNWAAWQTAKALGISARECIARFEMIQPMYSLARRQAEVELLPLAESEGLGVVPYSPLGAGLLTGKYGKGKRPEKGRIVNEARYKARYKLDTDFELADKFSVYAEKCGTSPTTLAVAWVMAHPAVTAPIIGARNVHQLEGSLAALDIDMTREWRDEISALSMAPAPATDRTETLDPGWGLK